MRSTTPRLLKYNVTPTNLGVLLKIWEPAPTSNHRLRPFLFMINQRLETADEAQQVLGEYLAAYGQDYAIDEG